VAGYALGRLWVEALRVDPASELWGLRINIWISVVALVAALGVLVVSAVRSSSAPGDQGRAGGSDDETATEAEPSRR
jgi:prolipoprotein diacylglyceryltransferase